MADDDQPQKITLDVDSLTISLVVAVQANQDVRDYLGFIAKTGALLDNSLAAAMGEVALITYNDEVTVAKPFGHGDLAPALKVISPSGHKANMVDAGIRAIEMLKERPSPSSRVLLFIGQPVESGSKDKLETLAANAERENIQIYALTLPNLGKKFVSDSFSVQGPLGGFAASVELTKAVPALRRAAAAASRTDPFSLLTVATGGIQLHFRRQGQLENAIIALGDALRSRYFLSYRPDPYNVGFHKISVNVDVPNTLVYARPGYKVEADQK